MRLPDEIASRLRGRLTLTVPEAGELLGIGRRQSYSMAREGTLPTLKLTERRVVVPLGLFLTWLGFESPNEEGGDDLSAPASTPTSPPPVVPLRTGRARH